MYPKFTSMWTRCITRPLHRFKFFFRCNIGILCSAKESTLRKCQETLCSFTFIFEIMSDLNNWLDPQCDGGGPTGSRRPHHASHAASPTAPCCDSPFAGRQCTLSTHGSFHGTRLRDAGDIHQKTLHRPPSRWPCFFSKLA